MSFRISVLWWNGVTINNPEAFMAGVWDWGILDGCFGETRIKPTDLDGMVERHGWFLVLETKAPGAIIPQGQLGTFEKLRATGKFTILVIWGPTNTPTAVQLMTTKSIKPPEDADIEKVRSIVANWYQWADRQAVYG